MRARPSALLVAMALLTASAAVRADDGKAPDAKPTTATTETRTTQMCIDQAIADRLEIKRQRRGAVDRLFVKQARHELSVGGGYYASDLFSGTYVLEAAYTYHMTENMGLEFGVAATHANAELIRAVEAGRGTVLDDTYAGVIVGESLLVWSPIYGKLELGGSVVHFDIHLDVGVGVVDAQTSRGAVGVGGVGIKLFAGNAVAFRIDLRDRTYQQQLLDDNFIVNDIAVTAGFSVFLPFSN